MPILAPRLSPSTFGEGVDVAEVAVDAAVFVVDTADESLLVAVEEVAEVEVRAVGALEDALDAASSVMLK